MVLAEGHQATHLEEISTGVAGAGMTMVRTWLRLGELHRLID